jgi:hypothetical protein
MVQLGLIPALEIVGDGVATPQDPSYKIDVDNSVIDKQNTIIDSPDILFDFAGYGVIKEKKLVGYLDREQSITCNILTNKFKGGNINVVLDDNEVIACLIADTKVKYKFKINQNKIEEINIMLNFKGNLEEVYTHKDIFTPKMLAEIAEKQSQQMKSRIQDIIDKVKEYDCDFLGIATQLKQTHPYKYISIKDNFMEQFKNAKINIEAYSSVRRTYDYINLGGGKT